MGRRYKGRVYQGMKPNSERQFTSKVFMQGAMSYLWRHKHFMKDCPHNEEQVDVNMNVHITLLSPNPESMQKSLVVDSLGNRLLDTGCWQFTLGSINWPLFDFINEFHWWEVLISTTFRALANVSHDKKEKKTLKLHEHLSNTP